MSDVQVTERLSVRPGVAPGARALALLRRHRALVALLAGAAALRIVALVAIYPGIWFSDTNNYVKVAATGTLGVARVAGYSLVVAPFWHLGSAGALIILQHLVGLGIVVLLYALLRRRGVPRLLALLAVVPAALDAYLIATEHAIMSDTVFHAVVLGAIALLLWNDRLAWPAALACGLLLGYAGVVRSVATPFFVLFVVYLLVRRVGWRPLAAFCLGWALVSGGYMTLYHSQHGKFAFTQYGGRFLYARVAGFANCAQMGDVPANERSLCPDPRHRLTMNGYLWSTQTPIRGLPPEEDSRIRDFAVRVIRDRPLTYARIVAGSFLHYFEPGHRIGRGDYSVAPWQFPTDPRRNTYPGYRGPIRPGSAHRRHSIDPNQYIGAMVGRPHTNGGASRFLHVYQRYAYTSGQVLAACLLVVLFALVRRRAPWRLRLDAALLAGAVLTALLVASTLSVFSYRYGLIGIVLLPAAAALAGTALIQAHRGGGAAGGPARRA